MAIDLPLMSDNIDKSDIEELIVFLRASDRYTNGPKVREFEKAWSDWLGVKYSVFVNSGSSANYLTMAGIKELHGDGEVILSPIGWESDIASVITAGLKPVFVDVNLTNLSMNEEQVISKINKNTKAVLLTHVLGYCGMTEAIKKACMENSVILVEDTCESHGAVFKGQKCGSIGDISNFSFYYAHHMSTIEGGMICTNDEKFYEVMRMMRSHGMIRERDDKDNVDKYAAEHPEVHPEFIFPVMGYNMRSTELNAVIGLNQLKRLNSSIEKRRENYGLFIDNLDKEIFFTDFDHAGSSNYAFVIMMRTEDDKAFEKVCDVLRRENVEFRRGTAGGGNFLRQPFVRKRYPDIDPSDYPNAEHIHNYGIYVGNYPGLEKEKILALCDALNKALL